MLGDAPHLAPLGPVLQVGRGQRHDPVSAITRSRAEVLVGGERDPAVGSLRVGPPSMAVVMDAVGDHRPLVAEGDHPVGAAGQHANLAAHAVGRVEHGRQPVVVDHVVGQPDAVDVVVGVGPARHRHVLPVDQVVADVVVQMGARQRHQDVAEAEHVVAAVVVEGAARILDEAHRRGQVVDGPACIARHVTAHFPPQLTAPLYVPRARRVVERVVLRQSLRGGRGVVSCPVLRRPFLDGCHARELRDLAILQRAVPERRVVDGAGEQSPEDTVDDLHREFGQRRIRNAPAADDRRSGKDGSWVLPDLDQPDDPPVACQRQLAALGTARIAPSIADDQVMPDTQAHGAEEHFPVQSRLA